MSWWSITCFAMRAVTFFAPCKMSSVSALCNLLIAGGNGSPRFGRIVAGTGEFVLLSLLWHPGPRRSGPAHRREERLPWGPADSTFATFYNAVPFYTRIRIAWLLLEILYSHLIFFKNKRYLSILSLPQKLFEKHTSFPIGFQKKKNPFQNETILDERWEAKAAIRVSLNWL